MKIGRQNVRVVAACISDVCWYGEREIKAKEVTQATVDVCREYQGAQGAVVWDDDGVEVGFTPCQPKGY